MNLNLPFNYKKHWNKRFNLFGFDILYAGNKGKSKEENHTRRNRKKEKLMKIIKELKIKKTNRVLDVGCGVGIFTEIFERHEFKDYTGIELLEKIVNELKIKFPKYNFLQKDLFKENLEGKYKLIIMISVTQHIIKDSHFKFVMNNIINVLDKDGYFIVTDQIGKGDIRDSHYTRRRSVYTYREVLNKLKLVKIIDDFENFDLMVFKK